MTKEEILKGLKSGKRLRCDRKDEPLLPWLLDHPDIENSGIVQESEQSSYIEFSWRRGPCMETSAGQPQAEPYESFHDRTFKENNQEPDFRTFSSEAVKTSATITCKHCQQPCDPNKPKYHLDYRYDGHDAEPEAAHLSGEDGERNGCITCHHPIGYHHHDGDACSVKDCPCEHYVAAQGQKDAPGLIARITDYLADGGLFNPEIAIHDRVRDLLIDCREVLRGGSPARSVQCTYPSCRCAEHRIPENENSAISSPDGPARSVEARDLLQSVLDSVPTECECCCICNSDLNNHASGCIVPIIENFLRKSETPARSVEARFTSAVDFWQEYYQEDKNFTPSEAACVFAEAYANRRAKEVRAVLSGSLPSPAPQPCDRCHECTSEALEHLAVIENADLEEGQSAVFELRKLLPTLDKFIKWEVEDAVTKVSGPSLPSEPHDITCIFLSSGGTEECNCSAKASERTRAVTEFELGQRIELVWQYANKTSLAEFLRRDDIAQWLRPSLPSEGTRSQRCPQCQNTFNLFIDWDKGDMGCNLCGFRGKASQFSPKPVAAPSDTGRAELCGEVVQHLIAGASWFPCALPKGHKEEGHRAAGNCIKHGVYLGEPYAVPKCPKWPDCIKEEVLTASDTGRDTNIMHRAFDFQPPREPVKPIAAPGVTPAQAQPRIVELKPPNAPDKYAVFIGKVFIWEFDYEHEAAELLGNLLRASDPQKGQGK